MRHGNDSLLGNVSSTGFIDVEEDSISPGWAVLLMYMMLVRQDLLGACSSATAAHDAVSGKPAHLHCAQFMILGAQTGLVLWRKHHKRSYELVRFCALRLLLRVTVHS